MRSAAISPATRYYLRCRDCVEPFVVTAERVDIYNHPVLCACGGKCEVMGPILGRRWARVEELCACDARCTGATGPSCDCACKGENHGTGRTVEVIRETGAIRLATCPDAARERGAEYRAALGAARGRIVARYGDVPAEKERGEWVSGDRYWGYSHATDDLVAAKRLRTHKGRIARLATVCAPLPGAAGKGE